MRMTGKYAALMAASWIAATGLRAVAATDAGPTGPASAERCADSDPLGDVAGHIAFLKNRLAITAAQDAAWNSYADILRDMAASRAATHRAPPPRPPAEASPDDRIKNPTEQIRDQDQAQAKLVQAANQLLPTLTDFQKGKASEILPGLVPLDGPSRPTFGPPRPPPPPR